MASASVPVTFLIAGALTVNGLEAAEAQGQESRRLTPKEQFESVQSEWQAAVKAELAARKEATTVAEKKAVFDRLRPDPLAFARRFLELAETHPDDPGGRDAVLWIVMQEAPVVPREPIPFSLRLDPSAEVLLHAVDLLMAHHANDLQVARTALFLSSATNVWPSFPRDHLFRPLFEGAKDREVKAVATLALAQYLERKARLASNVRKSAAGRTTALPEYGKHLLSCDAEAMRAEAQQLLERVIEEYGDVPFVRARGAETYVSDQGRNSRDVTQDDLTAKLTLSQVAESRLDEMLNLAVGNPAPEIEGPGLDGKPLKLSGYRGKVVVLVFWGTWCAPCMAEVPHERALAERLKDEPFAMLGVDCNDEKETARKVMERERITWPNWYDGNAPEGRIAKRYHITGFPSTFVLDAQGIIRAKGPRGERLEQVVDTLLKEMNQKGTPGSDGEELR
jgi:thiol-disulfide isomerase/thioredoxin